LAETIELLHDDAELALAAKHRTVYIVVVVPKLPPRCTDCATVKSSIVNDAENESAVKQHNAIITRGRVFITACFGEAVSLPSRLWVSGAYLP
jgi:hypothetical protein